MQISLIVLLLLGAECRYDMKKDVRVRALLNGGTKLINSCTSTVKRLKEEPADYVSIIAAGK
jgi:hypothetical protein